jgi:hypothetical protein
MILFCDIDGVLLPGRAYFMASQTAPIQLRFDPCVVGMVNRLCKDFNGQVVIHSNWRNTEFRRERLGSMALQEYFVEQGIRPEYMHAMPQCPKHSGGSDRWHDIQCWLDAHPEVEAAQDFWILEDTAPPADWAHASRVVLCNFDEGLTVSQYLDIRIKSGGSALLLPGNGGL